MNETELKQLLKTLYKDLNILKEREAKYGGIAPLDLLNQIDDHHTAIALVNSRLKDEISAEALAEQLALLTITPFNQIHQLERKFDKWVGTFPQESSKGFFGRDTDLIELHRLLQEKHIIGITGLRGVGKTQLAAEYAFAHEDDYLNIFWLTATDSNRLSVLAQLGRLGLPETDSDAADADLRMAQSLANYLDNHPTVLLVIDDIEDPADLNREEVWGQGIVPASFHCQILFTTHRQGSHRFDTHPLKMLSPDVACKLLLHYGGRPDEQDIETANKICVTLGYLPLALRLAAAYLVQEQNKKITLIEYLERLEAEGTLPVVDASGLSEAELETRHIPAVKATLQLQWKLVKDPEAQKLFCLAGLLKEMQAIPRPRLSLLTGLSQEAKPGYASPLDKTLAVLIEMSLVEELSNEWIQLHPLVREFAEQVATQDNYLSLTKGACYNLINAYKNPVILERNILQRPQGIDDVITDVREALTFSPPKRAISAFLQEFYRLLDLEAHNLRSSQAKEMPGFILQQLQNRAASEKMRLISSAIADELRSRTTPYLIHRYPIAGEPPVLIRTLRGHTNSVNACAITLDGKKVVSAGEQLRVWELATGREIAKMPSGGVSNCVVDGKRVVSVGRHGSSQVWDLITGEILSTLEEGTAWGDEALSCAITPDGSILAITYKEEAKLWDLINGRQLHTFKGQDRYIRSCAITPDGNYLITGSSYENTGQLYIWNIVNKEVYWTLDLSHHGIHSCAITPDGGKIITGATDGNLKVWDFKARCELITLKGHKDKVKGCMVTPNGKYLISASEDFTLKVWDLAIGHEITTLTGHSFYVNDCKVTPDGKYLISASQDTTLKIWDLERIYELQPKRSHRDEVSHCVITPDGRKVISASHDGTSKIWDIETGIEQAVLIGHRCAITPDGKKVITGCRDGTLRVWDVATGVELFPPKEHGESIHNFVVTPDGNNIISWSGSGSWLQSYFILKIWDITSQQELITLGQREYTLNYCKVTPDGTKIVLNIERNMYISDLSEPILIKLQGTLPEIFILNLSDALVGNINILFKLPDEYSYEDCVIPPDWERIVVRSRDGGLKIWDLDSGNLITTLSSDNERVMAISPNGRYIVSTLDRDYDSTLTIWDYTTGQKLNTLRGHRWKVFACAFTSDGKYLVSGSHDHTLRIWNLADGSEVTRLEGAADFLSIAVAPNNRDIIAGDALGNVHFLEFNAGRLDEHS